MAARSSKESGAFPYGYPGMVCYMEMRAGELTQLGTRDVMRDAVRRAQAGDSTIYAVWPGQYRSDLFIIDDLAALAIAVGVQVVGSAK
jgi:hypothetical protein